MPVENHALLSASSAHRWLYCPMLPRLEADYPSRDTVYTQEGTSAHELSEIKLMYKSGKITKRKFNTLTKAFKENSDFYNEEMEEMTELYTDIVMEHLNTYENAEIELEKTVDF
ncbi:PF10926 domain protein, partial [Streptococcus pyogenes GA06023]